MENFIKLEYVKKIQEKFSNKKYNDLIKNFKNGFKNILDTPEKRISELKQGQQKVSKIKSKEGKNI